MALQCPEREELEEQEELEELEERLRMELISRGSAACGPTRDLESSRVCRSEADRGAGEDAEASLLCNAVVPEQGAVKKKA